MKKIIALLVLSFSSIAMACVDVGNQNMVCPGDTVYTNYYSSGARVQAVNPRTRQILLKSNITSSTSMVSPAELFLVKGCADRDLCVGDTVYSAYYSSGARIQGINPTSRQLFVKSTITSSTSVVNASDLLVLKGCVSRGMCVGDTIYSAYYSSGARILAVDRANRQMMVKSNITSSTSIVSNRDALITRGCTEGICVGDGVYTNYYTSGAKVLAVGLDGRVMLKSSITSSTSIVTAGEVMVTDYCVDFNDERNLF